MPMTAALMYRLPLLTARTADKIKSVGLRQTVTDCAQIGRVSQIMIKGVIAVV